MKYIKSVVLVGSGVVIGFLANNEINKNDTIYQQQLMMQNEMEEAQVIGEQKGESAISTPEQHDDVTSDRFWALYSKDYTLVSDASMPIKQQSNRKEWLVHHITKNGALGRVVMFQTRDEPLTFLQKMQGYEGEYMTYVITKNTSQGLSRKLFDGMAESQYFVTQTGDMYLYFFDTFTARGCGDEEICIDANNVLDHIGWK